MKYCTEFEALLDLYVDGELPAEEMIRVQAHLDTCPGCQAYVDDLLAIRAAFPDAEDTVVPEGFAESVMAAVQKSAAPAKKTNRSTPWKKVLLPLAACCAVVVLAIPFSGMKGAKMEAAPAAAPAETAPEAPSAAAVTAYAADAVAEEADTESAAMDSPAEEPAEAPAAPAANIVDDTMQKAPDMAQYTADAEPAAGMETGRAAKLSCASLTLTAEEAGTLLDDYEAAEETEAELLYRLSAEEFNTLIAALAEADVEAVVSQTGGNDFTVTVIK